MRTLFLSFLLLGTACVPKADYEKLQQENTRLKKELNGNGTPASQQLKEIKQDLKPLIDKGILSVEVVDGRVVIGMTADVLFSSGSANLSSGGQAAVSEVARLLARRAGDQDFQVEGHTDSEAIATAEFPDNWYLGSARAIVVAKAMVSSGFPADHISAATFAQYAPVVPNTSDANKARNRRIEIVLLPDISAMPGYKQLMQDGNGRKKR